MKDAQEIAIVELDFHHDSVDGLIRILQDHVACLHVFTTLHNRKLLSGISYRDNVRFHDFRGGSKWWFLRKHQAILSSCDIVFVNTIAQDFGAYTKLAKMDHVILRIHNINKQFVPFRSIVWPRTVHALWKFCSFIGRQCILKLFPVYRTILNRRIQHFTFPDDGLRDYVLRNNYLPAEKVIASIPLKSFSGTTAYPKLDQELVVTIIGGIDPSRRDYQQAIEAVRLSLEQIPELRIKLVLLGKSKGRYGEWVLEELAKNPADRLEIVSFQDYIPEERFMELMLQTHLTISPFVAATKTDIFREFYGKTKTSGSILDSIKFGIVTLVPDYYDPPADLSGFMIKYENAEALAAKLCFFAAHPQELDRLNAEAKSHVAAHFAPDRIYEQCRKAFAEIMEKCK